MTRIAIIGGTFSGNRGAQAMLATTIGRMRELVPDAEFLVFSYYPEDDRRLAPPEATVRSATPLSLVTSLFPGALLGALTRMLGLGGKATFGSARDLAACDVLIDLAGVSFVDGREKFLPFNILTIWPAMLLGVPVVKFSQALGPFRNPVNRLAARTFLPRCARVFARGERTYENLRTLGLPSPPLDRAADVAFSFRAEDTLPENPEHLVEVLGRMRELRGAGRVLVGMCPSSVVASKAAKDGWDYPALLAAVARRLIDQGAGVLLFPNATREAHPDKLRNNDLPVIAQVAALLPAREEALAVVSRDLDAGSIRRLVEECDTVIVSRFHAMVGALEAAVPVMVLGWSHKYLEVMEQFGLAEYVFDHSEHDPVSTAETAERLLAEREIVRERIQTALPRVRESSATQFAEALRIVSASERQAVQKHS